MFIATVYLSTYRQDAPISGHFDVKDVDFLQKIDFSVDEAATIQEVCAKALERTKSEAAAKLLSADVRVPQLEAPKPAEPTVQDGEWSEVPS